MFDVRNRKPIVPIGRLTATPAVLDAVPLQELLAAVRRHMRGDWGSLSESDWKENDWALKNGERLLSAYESSGSTKFWIITEWDRSYTTVLLPSEY